MSEHVSNKIIVKEFSIAVEKASSTRYNLKGSTQSLLTFLDPTSIFILSSLFKTAEISIDKISEVFKAQNSSIQISRKIGDVEKSIITYDLSFVFESGLIRLNPKSTISKNATASASGSTHRLDGSSATDLETVFKVPRMKVEACHETGGSLPADRSKIYVKVEGSSHNVNPNVLDFLSQSLDHFDRMKTLFKFSGLETKSAPQIQKKTPANSVPSYKYNIYFILETAGNTNINLQTIPISKVSLSTDIEKVFLFMNTSNYISVDPNLETSSLHLLVPTVSSKLKHSFSPEECFAAYFEDIQLNASFLKLSEKNRRSLSLLSRIKSIVCNLNVRYLQDYYIFENVFIKNFMKLFTSENRYLMILEIWT